MVRELPRTIKVRTPELVCFHEAGHVATALAIGAKVVRVELFDGSSPHGVSSIERDALQAPFIACGGLAAEFFLQQTQRLCDGSGRPVDIGVFLSEARLNAKEDIKNFLRGMNAINAVVDDPIENFIGIALAKVYPQLDFVLVETLASNLLANGVLGSEQIAALAGSAPHKIASQYRLSRMIGYGRFRSGIRALLHR